MNNGDFVYYNKKMYRIVYVYRNGECELLPADQSSLELLLVPQDLLSKAEIQS
ncbi:hypothetical protein GJU40_04820 [Bacillus lacus]|uniref:Uncharacterized protein n=1 Tax=Metabacillus lacus TaxID=1983721 RepID=A0A7X2LZ21_9BACI|nr:hypothetical protein [Metabacillus lacus]MRX71497.1 hypothetical protein [Metabacillus lacus]